MYNSIEYKNKIYNNHYLCKDEKLNIIIRKNLKSLLYIIKSG